MRAIIFAALLVGCSNPPPAPIIPGALEASGEVVMVVNGQEVTSTMIDAVTRRVPPEQLAQMKAAGRYSEFEDRIAMGQVLYDRAIEKGLHNDPEIGAALAMAQRDVLAAELIDAVSEEAVTDEKLKEAYEKRAMQYKRPQVHARHILVKLEQADLAKEIVDKLAAGGDFAALAQAHSTDPGSKVKGGDLGWFEAGRMVPAFSEAAFAAAPKTVVGPVESRYGFHIIEVLEKRDATPFEDVKDELKAMVKKDAVKVYLEEVKEAAKITRPGDKADGGETSADTEGAAAPAATDAPAAPAAHAHGAGDGHGH